VAIVFRHKPLPMHRNARPAALAMQAAHQQGKAWEMHDMLFADYKAITPEAIDGYAEKLGLDVAKFKTSMGDPKIGEQIDKDSKTADDAGARGTPTFFVNGRRVRGARPFEDFKRIIDEEIKKADALIAKGTPIADVYDKLAKNQKAN
jgi:protein-disulfide isomerase